MFFSSPQNPWIEDPLQPAKAAAVPLLELARFAERNTSFCKTYGVDSLGDNARTLATLIQENRDIYVSHRRLFVVRIPELQIALETLRSLPSDTDTTPLVDEIRVASAELSVLVHTSTEATRAKAISSAVLSLELTRPATSADVLPVSKRSRLLDKVGFNRLSTTLQGVQNAVGKVSTTSRSYVSLATVISKHAVLGGVSFIAMPVRARVSALITAVDDTVGVAVVGGLLATVLFPPALPLAIGYAYLTAGASYRAALDDTLSKEEQERALREQGASAEVARALAAVRGQKVIRLETAHLMAELDLQSDQFDGTILSGRYSGARLSELDLNDIMLLQKTAPDFDTAKLLNEYIVSLRA